MDEKEDEKPVVIETAGDVLKDFVQEINKSRTVLGIPSDEKDPEEAFKALDLEHRMLWIASTLMMHEDIIHRILTGMANGEEVMRRATEELHQAAEKHALSQVEIPGKPN